MAELNIQWVCVVAIVMQETYGSARQFRDFVFTPADDEIRDIIDYIHSKGMKVQLRPMLECFDGSQRIHITFMGDDNIMPGRPFNHATRWFNGMTERTLHYARLATRSGCEVFGIDSEIDQITHFNTQWKQVVSAARSVYKGHVTSSHTGAVNFLRDLTDRQDHWFRDLDSLGTSFYTPVSNRAGSTMEEMLEYLKPALEHHRRIAALYGKPFYFGEVGCCAAAGATRKPWGWDNPGGYDGQEQANFMEAVFRTFWSEPWWMGMYWWKWEEQNDRPGFREAPSCQDSAQAKSVDQSRRKARARRIPRIHSRRQKEDRPGSTVRLCARRRRRAAKSNSRWCTDHVVARQQMGACARRRQRLHHASSRRRI